MNGVVQFLTCDRSRVLKKGDLQKVPHLMFNLTVETGGGRGNKGEKPVGKSMSLSILITDVLAINHQILNARGPAAPHDPTECVP